MKARDIDPDRIPDGFRRVRFGPPRGVAEEDCYSHDAIVGQWQGGAFDGAHTITVLVEVEPDDFERLQAQAVPTLELTIVATSLPPWLLVVADLDEGDQEGGA